MKLQTKIINELIEKQKKELKKAMAKENAKLEKLHRQFSESILKECLKNSELKELLLENKNLKDVFKNILEFYDSKSNTNSNEEKTQK